MDNVERALRSAVQGCNPHYCAEAADLLGIEHPDCLVCGGDECDECAERVADAIAAHLTPEGVQWPRFGDGEPVRFGDEAAGFNCIERVGFVRAGERGWTLLSDYNEVIDSGEHGVPAIRPMQPEPAAFGPVRCAGCKHARAIKSGLVCSVHGDAGWFATDADGYCHRGERR